MVDWVDFLCCADAGAGAPRDWERTHLAIVRCQTGSRSTRYVEAVLVALVVLVVAMQARLFGIIGIPPSTERRAGWAEVAVAKGGVVQGDEGLDGENLGFL
ncbi:hypothetical protein K449DRAFT_440946 [Hypoxylon sp. EC38]|nr:hypothetical protein K449DRAFT_440946 [Hypoxylon sp. EC38]